MIWKAWSLPSWWKKCNWLCNKEYSQKNEVRKSPFSLTFLLSLSLTCCHPPLIIPFCWKHSILTDSAVHIVSLLISRTKTGKVTKHFQDYLCLSWPFNSPWAVTNYWVNLEDLFSVSWGRNLNAVNRSWKSPCSDLQKSRLLFSQVHCIT